MRVGSAYPSVLPVFLTKRSSIDPELLELITDLLGARALPVFNSGVVLLQKTVSAERLAGHWPGFLASGAPLPPLTTAVPLQRPHIIEKVVACIALGTFEPFTWSHISRDSCPW